MSNLPNCPACNSAYAYEDRSLYVCPECGHEWNQSSTIADQDLADGVQDSNGNTLQDGDTISVTKDLKVKGSSSVVKVGTKVKNIRLVDGDHNIDCKIDGIGAMKLKSEFVKKV
jgi:protein PhnA